MPARPGPDSCGSHRAVSISAITGRSREHPGMPGEAGRVPAGRGARQRGVRVPGRGWHRPGRASRSKSGTKQLGSVPSNLPPLVPAGTGRSEAEESQGGSGIPPTWSRLSLSFSLPKGIQGCAEPGLGIEGRDTRTAAGSWAFPPGWRAREAGAGPQGDLGS